MRSPEQIAESADPDYAFARLSLGFEVLNDGEWERGGGLVLIFKTGAPGVDPYWRGSLSSIDTLVRLQTEVADCYMGANLANSLTAPARWAATSRKAVARG